MPPDSSRGYKSAAARRPTPCNFISTNRWITASGRSVCARSGSATFSATVRSVSRPLPCSSTPMLLRSSSKGRLARGTDWPKISTVPAAGTSSPVSAANSVDLPLPDGPSTAVTLPRGTDSAISLSTARPPRSRRTSVSRTAGLSAVIGTEDPGEGIRKNGAAWRLTAECRPSGAAALSQRRARTLSMLANPPYGKRTRQRRGPRVVRRATPSPADFLAARSRRMRPRSGIMPFMNLRFS